jgi:hypothetical protein
MGASAIYRVWLGLIVGNQPEIKYVTLIKNKKTKKIYMYAYKRK